MYGKFLVEGDKPVRELLNSSFKIDAIYSVEDWQKPVVNAHFEHILVTESELKRVSTLENPNMVVAVVACTDTAPPTDSLAPGLYLALDTLNDPGNAGSIIRIADWFGIKAVFFSNNSVDVFNPKVVNSAKGSLFRVPCYYTDLKNLFAQNRQLNVYGAFMDGENIYNANLSNSGIILIGNEANGISSGLLPFITQKIAIPSFGNAESLNAAVATGVIVSEFSRRLA